LGGTKKVALGVDGIEIPSRPFASVIALSMALNPIFVIWNDHFLGVLTNLNLLEVWKSP